ncbi:MAG: hypothetical protein H0V17_23860 [Deltaproteobacteria bacterium]|nr:hypothetical protein [Deltaproteobacteria bacterium]
MASIRIVDYWMRSPASVPSHYRSVMVVTEKWAEQRVLMRAYADSRDQTCPTIVLHGQELAIGPAGTDINGPWGVHVGSQVGEGDERAREIKNQLEAAAKRLAGSKGNPPRLADEESTFEREPTANWGPGAPRILPKRQGHHTQPPVSFVENAGAARIPNHQAATIVPQMQVAHHVAPAAGVQKAGNDFRQTPLPRRRSGLTRQPMTANARTALGYQSGSGAQSALVRLGLTPQVSARLGRLVDRVVPADFHIDPGERRILNALGDGPMTARAIGNLMNLADAVAYMEELTRKLENYNLDLVEPGDPDGDEPSYRLRR